MRHPPFRALLLSATMLASLAPALGHAADAPAAAGDADQDTTVTVIGKRVIKGSAGATGLDLSLRQTPQSVTVVTAQQIQDFSLNTANELLATLPGINVESVETDRTYYNSRGFDITNFQVDGVGQPLIWGIQYGDLDTAIYDRIEAIRGANGMMTGTGNPSATINYIRKRPTKDFQAEVDGSYGSFNDRRIQADVSGPLNASGTVEGRLVYANEQSDSWLNYYGVKRNVYYGIASWDITPRLKLTGGYSQQDNLAHGNSWGALPLTYAYGSPTTFPVSATTAAPWTYWNTHDKTAFTELSYAFDNGWTTKAVLTHRSYDYDARLLYAYNYPDKTTGLGVDGMSGLYPAKADQTMFDAMATGPFTLFGRQHEAVIGVNLASATTKQWEAFSSDAITYPALSSWGAAYPATPTYPDAYLAEDTRTHSSRLYGAVHLNLTDQLKGIVGFNAIHLKETGFSYGVDQTRSDDAVSPYVGAVYDLTKNVSAYASYSDIFNPQIQTDINHKELPAAKGKSYEAGLKTQWFGDRLLATAAVFKSEQYGLAQFAGYYPGTADSYYSGVDTFVKGYELEVAGKLTPTWSLNGGWTDLSVKDPSGADIRTYEPRKTLKLSTTYAIPQWRDLKLGAAVRWQGDISTVDQATTITQKAYSVTDLMASFRIAPHVTAALNVKNAFNKKYWASLEWNQALYAAPQSVTATLTYRY